MAARRRGRLGQLIEGLLALPWAVPGTVFAIALATAFSVRAPWAGRFILVGTLWILPLAYLVRNLPITSRAILAGARALDPALDEAAGSLGAGRWRTLRQVTLPLLRPALLAVHAVRRAASTGVVGLVQGDLAAAKGVLLGWGQVEQREALAVIVDFLDRHST